MKSTPYIFVLSSHCLLSFHRTKNRLGREKERARRAVLDVDSPPLPPSPPPPSTSQPPIMPHVPSADLTPPIPKELLDSAVATADEVAAVLAPSSSSSLLSEYKVKFIEGALEAKALIFGEFTLKSGRCVPPFLF